MGNEPQEVLRILASRRLVQKIKKGKKFKNREEIQGQNGQIANS